MKILITGGTGSLGAALTRHFSNLGNEVIVVGRTENPPEKLLSCSSYIKEDISKSFKLPDADVCIHTAALSSDSADPEMLYKVNVIGTENVIKATQNSKIFIHISSSSVFSASSHLITEDMTGVKQMLSPYGKSKLEAEEIIKTNCSHSSVFILRPRAIYGPGDRVLLPRLLTLVKNGKFLRLGKMNVKLSMTHFDNVAHAIECCICSQMKGFHTYNVSDQESYILYDVVKKLINEIYERNLPEKAVPIWLLKVMSTLKIKRTTSFLIHSLTQNMILDISKIQNELNYQPQLSFDSSYLAIANWVKSVGGTDVVRRADKDLPWRE